MTCSPGSKPRDSEFLVYAKAPYFTARTPGCPSRSGRVSQVSKAHSEDALWPTRRDNVSSATLGVHQDIQAQDRLPPELQLLFIQTLQSFHRLLGVLGSQLHQPQTGPQAGLVQRVEVVILSQVHCAGGQLLDAVHVARIIWLPPRRPTAAGAAHSPDWLLLDDYLVVTSEACCTDCIGCHRVAACWSDCGCCVATWSPFVECLTSQWAPCRSVAD